SAGSLDLRGPSDIGRSEAGGEAQAPVPVRGRICASEGRGRRILNRYAEDMRRSIPMHLRVAMVAALAAMIAGCGPVDTMKEGFAHSKAVSAELEKSLGLKSFVGFNWSNGSLTSVNVTFRGIPANVSLTEIATKSKQA